MKVALPSLAIVRTVRASPAQVWAAITKPEQMILWWGPDAGPTTHVEADVRPGGHFSVVFQLLNGEKRNPTGIYQQVVPEEKLVFTWDLPGTPEPTSLVTFHLQPSAEGTVITLTHEHLPDEDTRASHQQGWVGLLDNLSMFLGDRP